MTKQFAEFEPVLLPGDREGTAYFELHIGERPDEFACWLPGSLCVRDSGFDFICECFHSASKEFDYFEFVRFESTEIDRLVEELSKFIAELSGSPSREILFSRFASIFGPTMWADADTAILAVRVRVLAEAVREYAKQALSRRECLWVLGM